MIKINLIPPERQKVEKTPLPVFISICAIVALITCEIILGLYLIIQNRNCQSQITAKKNDMKRLENAVKEHDQIKADIERIEKRKKMHTLLDAERGKTWTEILDTMWDVINEFDFAWVDNISGEYGGKAPTGATKSRIINRSFKLDVFTGGDRILPSDTVVRRFEKTYSTDIFNYFTYSTWTSFPLKEDFCEKVARKRTLTFENTKEVTPPKTPKKK